MRTLKKACWIRAMTVPLGQHSVSYKGQAVSLEANSKVQRLRPSPDVPSQDGIQKLTPFQCETVIVVSRSTDMISRVEAFESQSFGLSPRTLGVL